MLMTKVIGNIGTEEEIAGKKTEWIELDWEELSKRILRTETDQGTDHCDLTEHLNQRMRPAYNMVIFLFEDDRTSHRSSYKNGTSYRH